MKNSFNFYLFTLNRNVGENFSTSEIDNLENKYCIIGSSSHIIPHGI